MKKRRVVYIIIFLAIILISGFVIKNNLKSNTLEAQTDQLDSPSGTKIDDSEDKSNQKISDLKLKGYILSINDGDVDFEQIMKKVNLQDKKPVYSQLSSTYNSAAIIQTNQKIGPIYLVDCKYDKQKKTYSINKNSKQLITEFIQNCDALVFLHSVDSDIAKKAILIEAKDKNYYYPLSRNTLDDLSGEALTELK
ncbi:MAG: hypothetical protein E7A06_08975 [Clostridiales bacterium]|jgi:hypothetical protein|uniref:hypothetical protein n=1 Tax=Clostridia TaxID=186801 RepID=UPI0018A9D75C|nr:hypothetical protein [Clostridium sp. 1001270J_160509_D11]MDU1203071.1 hypothetical protein [Clostridiales bacterium]